LLFVGRFDLHKGADILLRAFARLARDRPEVRLLFVGPDTGLSQGGRRIGLKEYLESELPSSVRAKVEYFGALSRYEIEPLRRRAFVTVVPSRYETFGNVVTEAMAMGCPLVATSTGGIAETVSDRRNGLLVVEEDAQALADAVNELFGDPALAARLGEQAASDCEEYFHPRKIAEQTLQFYSAILERNPNKRV
jgi:glycosyltransferase involved in cell wall biosynthesis